MIIVTIKGALSNTIKVDYYNEERFQISPDKGPRHYTTPSESPHRPSGCKERYIGYRSEFYLLYTIHSSVHYLSKVMVKVY